MYLLDVLTDVMLRCGSYTLGLYAANMSCRKLAGQKRIFGIALKVSAAERMSMNAHCRCQAH
jgi:hypothetical protein